MHWIVFWYDGNNNRASIVNFGDDPAKGPFGHEEDIITAIYAALPDDDKYDEDRTLIRESEIMLNGMIHIDLGGTPAYPAHTVSVIIADQEVEMDFDKSIRVNV